MDVEIRRSKIHGRGLFATRFFIMGELIAKTPCILVPRPEIPHGNVLWPYTFDYGDKDWLVGLGVVAFVNHSKNPNAEVIYNIPTQEILLTAVTPIHRDDEIHILYKEGRI